MSLTNWPSVRHPQKRWGLGEVRGEVKSDQWAMCPSKTFDYSSQVSAAAETIFAVNWQLVWRSVQTLCNSLRSWLRVGGRDKSLAINRTCYHLYLFPTSSWFVACVAGRRVVRPSSCRARSNTEAGLLLGQSRWSPSNVSKLTVPPSQWEALVRIFNPAELKQLKPAPSSTRLNYFALCPHVLKHLHRVILAVRVKRERRRRTLRVCD